MAGNIALPMVYRTTSQLVIPASRVITDVSAFYGLTNADVIAVDDDVKAGEVYNLMSTLVGDEPHLPTFGCDLPKRTFEPITDGLLQLMTQDAFLSARVWIPDILVVTAGCLLLALPQQRVAGIVVAYQFAGETYSLPINLVQIGNA